MKKIISLTLCLVMLISLFALTISANTEFQSVQAQNRISKREFAEQCDAIEASKQRTISYSLSDKVVSDLLFEYSTSLNPKKYEPRLNELGIYVYETRLEYIESRSTPNDIYLNFVSIARTSPSDHWIVIASGNWISLDQISDDVGGWFYPSIGDTKNVSGHDAIGYVFYETSGITPTIVYSECNISDSQSSNRQIYRNPATYNERTGIMYQYQDQIICTDNDRPLPSYDWDYIGAKFNVATEYDETFVDFNGMAKTAYVHTYSTEITSLSIGVQDVSVGFSSENGAFTIYSQTRVSF